MIRPIHRPPVAEAASAPSLLQTYASVQAPKPTIGTTTQRRIAPAEGDGCFCPSRKFSQPVIPEAISKAAPAATSQ